MRILKSGEWLITLDLIENSPATYLDSCVTIGASFARPEPSQGMVSNGMRRITSPFRSPSTEAAKLLPPIVLRMRSPGSSQLSGDAEAKKRGWDESAAPIISILSDHVHGSSLEHDGCPYIRSDGSLQVLLEVNLVKPDNSKDCIIM